MKERDEERGERILFAFLQKNRQTRVKGQAEHFKAKNISTKSPRKGSQNKLKAGDDRYTVVLPLQVIEQIKRMAFYSGKKQKEIAAEAFKLLLAKFMTEHPQFVRKGEIAEINKEQ